MSEDQSGGRFWLATAFAEGLAAGAAFTAVDLAARLVAGVPTLPELVEDRLVLQLPGPVFAFLLARFDYLGKPLLFAALLVTQVIIGGIVALAIAHWGRPLHIVAALWLLTGVALLPLVGDSFFGGHLSVAVVLALAFAAYLAVLEAMWHPGWPSSHAARRSPSKVVARREFLGGGALFVLSAVLARQVIGAIPTIPRQHGLPSPITSAADFYVVSKDLSDPRVAASGWGLRVDGLVAQSLTLDYAGLLAMPAQDVVRTLECISNEVGGHLVSNGRWTGFHLADLLQRVGVKPAARFLNFTAADGYTEFMTLQQAMDPDTFLVYRLDGQPLPVQHGYPLRVLGAGTYGMKNPKWLTHIDVASVPVQGYWEEQGWSPTAIVRTMSRIDVPGTSLVAGEAVEFAGIAFAGDRGIKLVELSTDGGATWGPTQLSPSLGDSTWRLWRTVVNLHSGLYTVQVRATDGHGTQQTSHATGTFPGGATGYDSLRLGVE